jgi:cysteine-rich repeat protein
MAHNWDESCGIIGNSWCVQGASANNEFGLCARRQEFFVLFKSILSVGLVSLLSCGPPGAPGGGDSVCGNRTLEPGEQCDDGNDFDGDACTNSCRPAGCGDGSVWEGQEECDDGNANDDCQNNCFEPRGEFFLVGHGGWNFYKVPVLGRMSDVNVHAACQAAGLVTPCAGAAGCRYNNNNCTVTSEVGCGNPMMTTAGRLCNGARPNACVAIRDTFTYMGGNWSAGSSCGVVGNSWCAAGNSYTNKYAFCARRQ